MSLLGGRVTVTVPASSANLGPGFDALGLALELRDTLHAEVIESGLEIEVTGSGAESVPRDASHLVVRSMRSVFEVLGESPSGLRLTCENVIPHARGLGSSSAAIVGGLALARALVADGDERLSDDELFELAAEIEGHPDNVAPAVYGGFTIAGHDETFYSVSSPVDPGVSAVVFIPPTGVETRVARGLLPAQVPHADAAANSGRAALMVAALGFAPDQLLRATRDYLHQDYRRAAMPESLALVDSLRVDGIAAIVSGAGPTVLAFATDQADELLSRTPVGWVSHHLEIDHDGVRVEMRAPQA